MKKEMIVLAFRKIAEIMEENKERLIDMDQVVGDGDLGLTMSDGFRSAYLSASQYEGNDIGVLFYQAGKAMATAVPSTMGTLMASGLMQAGKSLKEKQILTNEDVVQFLKNYYDGVAQRGKAKVGEKTFLDGFHPAVLAFASAVEEQKTLKDSFSLACLAAKQGYHNTKGMIAVHGRAATRGIASKELLDPGAYVAYLLMKALSEV